MSELRIGTADRESAVAALGEHYAHGRLEKEEYDARCDAVWSARTASDLQPVFVDLPGGSPVRDVTAYDAPGPARPLPLGPTPRSRARDVWRGLPSGVQVVLAVVLALLVLTNLPLVIVVGLVWFVLARHGVARPPWAHDGSTGRYGSRRCGG